MGNKRVLYIGTPFFGYYKHIIKEFEKQGYIVDYYNDRPSENSIIKGIIKIKPTLMNNLIQRYFEKIVNETKIKEYNLVFIVNCKVFNPNMIKVLKETHQSAKFVLYMWDSLDLYPNSKELISVFDKAYSFDTYDCENILNLDFLPLFYHEGYEQIATQKEEDIKYDIVSVCTAHPNRYTEIQPLFKKLNQIDINIFSYMFLNKFQYLYNKMCVKEFKKSRINEFQFKPLNDQEYLKILKKSTAVFDIPHSKQNGLTMRTIETLGANKKLITTNENIKKYNFYNSNNILVLKNKNIFDIKQFLEGKYEKINDSIYKQYSIRNWVSTVINGSNKSYLKE